MEVLEKYKAKFIELLRAANREGMDSLLEWLEGTDFYTAPASTRFHGSYEGGLLEHSVKTCRILRILAKTFDLDFPQESMDICALLHDLCKIDFYKNGSRNVKGADGRWESVPVYMVEDKFPFGHGEKSVMLILRHIHLTDAEALAIRWHMGSYDDAAQSYGGSTALSAAYAQCPLAVALHMADMAETHLIKNKSTEQQVQFNVE